MGYYTDTIDSVAPKGADECVESLATDVYRSRQELFKQIKNNENFQHDGGDIWIREKQEQVCYENGSYIALLVKQENDRLETYKNMLNERVEKIEEKEKEFSDLVLIGKIVNRNNKNLKRDLKNNLKFVTELHNDFVNLEMEEQRLYAIKTAQIINLKAKQDENLTGKKLCELLDYKILLDVYERRLIKDNKQQVV